jgi:hypothetical protein
MNSDFTKKYGDKISNLEKDEKIDKSSCAIPSTAYLLSEMQNPNISQQLFKDYFELLPKIFDEFPVFFIKHQKYRDAL